MDSSDLSEILAESSTIGLINPLRGQTVRFRHAIIADACATTVPKATKQKVHQRAIDVISVLYSDLDQHYEQLAFHAENAGDDENAIEYYWLAGLRARKRSATDSLLLIFKQALSCMNRVGAPANDRYVDFVLMAYASLIQVGEFTEMKSHLPRALELVKQQGNVEKICAALCNQGMANWFDGLYQSGLATTEEALVMARAMNSMPHIFASQLMMASVLHGMGKVKEAINLQRELCDLFPDDSDGARLGATAVPASMARSFLSWFLLDIGQFDEAYDTALAAANIAKNHSDTYSDLLSQTSIARSLLALGRALEARSVLEAAKDAAEREGYDALVPHLAGRLAVSMTRTGGAADAIELVEGLLDGEVANRTGRSEMINLYLGYSEALVESGQQQSANNAVEEALKMARSIGNPSLEIQALSIKLHAQRRFDATEQDIDATIAEIEKLCATYSVIAAGTPSDPKRD